jgi:hypothetical protein
MILRHEKMEVPLLWHICRQFPLNHLNVGILKNFTKPCSAPVVARPNDQRLQARYTREEQPGHKSIQPVPEAAIAVNMERSHRDFKVR